MVAGSRLRPNHRRRKRSKGRVRCACNGGKLPRIATEDVVGTIRPKLRAVIEAKVSGRIEQMRVVPGQRVKAGELLVQLDAREIQARHDQAQALREAARREFKRREILLQDKLISQAEFDAADAQLRVAEAAFMGGLLATPRGGAV
jgi:multidrug efflux pump subunit AcrA (membrane-fusion protein)